MPSTKPAHQYVALLRGIAPLNPNMHNDKLRGVFEVLGFTNVRTVISSGNVLFESDSTDVPALEAAIQAAWPDRLGFTSTTIIRSRQQLQQLVDSDPFKGVDVTPSSNQNVTFIKAPSADGAPGSAVPAGTGDKLKFPHRPEGKEYTLLALKDGAIFSVIDLQTSRTPDLMTWLERHYGKDITTRTFKTVGRILAKFDS